MCLTICHVSSACNTLEIAGETEPQSMHTLNWRKLQQQVPMAAHICRAVGLQQTIASSSVPGHQLALAVNCRRLDAALKALVAIPQRACIGACDELRLQTTGTPRREVVQPPADPECITASYWETAYFLVCVLCDHARHLLAQRRRRVRTGCWLYSTCCRATLNVTAAAARREHLGYRCYGISC